MAYKTVADVEQRLIEAGYIPSREIATVIFLAQATQKPVLIEGPAGVGKTELAKAVARSLDRELIRLQCYEGLDEAKALYEWEYAKQLLYTQMVKDRINDIIGATATLTEAVDQIAAQEDAFSPIVSSSRVRFYRPSVQRNPSCCSWTKWISPIRSLKPFFWNCSAIFRFPSPNWERARPSRFPLFYSHPTTTGI
ncbi:MAG: MoxR family ATPase [Desulfobacterales bacterium]|nr:MoxR family ATPase [Desulfobacterales bacterium]